MATTDLNHFEPYANTENFESYLYDDCALRDVVPGDTCSLTLSDNGDGMITKPVRVVDSVLNNTLMLTESIGYEDRFFIVDNNGYTLPVYMDEIEQYLCLLQTLSSEDHPHENSRKQTCTGCDNENFVVCNTQENTGDIVELTYQCKDCGSYISRTLSHEEWNM